MDKVLVKKAVSAQYPVGAGAPIMVLGGGGRGGRARTLRESAGGLAGGALGALGALTGQHRSLGSLVQSGISGAAQGGAIGRGLGRVFVGPESQARANLRQEMADKYAAARASGEFDRYGVSSRRTPRTRVGVSRRADEMGSSLYDLEQAKQAEKDMLAQQRAEAMARAKAQGTQHGEEDKRHAALSRKIQEAAAQGMSLDDYEQRINLVYAAAQNQQQQGGQPGGTVQVVSADGTPQGNVNEIAQLPQNSRIGISPPGTVGSGDESADPDAGKLQQDGFNNTTEGEPSDLPPPAVMQSPNEGSGVTDEQIASLRASAEKLGRQMGRTPQGNMPPQSRLDLTFER